MSEDDGKKELLVPKAKTNAGAEEKTPETTGFMEQLISLVL